MLPFFIAKVANRLSCWLSGSRLLSRRSVGSRGNDAVFDEDGDKAGIGFGVIHECPQEGIETFLVFLIRLYVLFQDRLYHSEVRLGAMAHQEEVGTQYRADNDEGEKNRVGLFLQGRNLFAEVVSFRSWSRGDFGLIHRLSGLLCGRFDSKRFDDVEDGRVFPAVCERFHGNGLEPGAVVVHAGGLCRQGPGFTRDTPEPGNENE
jgi:hypothetical protein